MGERLKGKVAVVSGAGSVGTGWGNGKATSVVFAREGARIFAVDISLKAAEETRRVIEGEGGECFAFEADVSRSGQVENMVARCVEIYGRVDVLQNNVGIVQVGGPVEISEAQWDRLFEVNIKSMFLTCREVLPIMERQGSGVIVNVSSIASTIYAGYPSAAYSASKAAVNQLTRSIAMEYAARGIRANCVLPGLMNTPMIVEALSSAYHAGAVEEMMRKRDASVPMGKMGDAWDVAQASLFLASEEAKYITGVLLAVDGGLTCKGA
jgi:NAD(P)-dependent dehydrogenase (short-subunit alcohol dehydrogenase family)